MELQEQKLFSGKRKLNKLNKCFTFISIEHFFKIYIQNSETKYTYNFKNDKVSFMALKPIFYKKEYSEFNVTKAVMTIIVDAINNLPENTSFYRICDKYRKKFEIKSNDEIIPSKNEDEINKLVFKLFKDTYEFLFKAFRDFNCYFNKNWTYFSSYDEEIYYETFNKKDNGLELTPYEEKLIKNRNINNKIKNEFKKITTVDYELFKSCDGWRDNLVTSFFSFEEKDLKAGFYKLKNFLASGEYNKTEIENEHNEIIKKRENELKMEAEKSIEHFKNYYGCSEDESD